MRWPSLHAKNTSSNAVGTERIPLEVIISHPEWFPIKLCVIKNSQFAANTSLVVKLFIGFQREQLEAGRTRTKPSQSGLEGPVLELGCPVSGASIELPETEFTPLQRLRQGLSTVAQKHVSDEETGPLSSPPEFLKAREGA